ncbi:MAG TPA: hypothetical protein PLQ97_13445 [Myxococcota bacterium]|nr:hypothetical protein [Myxococcota bacterium]HQK52231.1 hypothetical protein [Myxococcota bacterium]
MDEALFLDTVRRAWEDLRGDLRSLGPVTGRRLVHWFTSLRGRQEPWRYLTDVRAFPLLRLPWFAEESLAERVDGSLQRALIRSSMAGYLHIRLIDDSTDRNSPETLALLPALGPLHLIFEDPYRRLFPVDHPFFEDFRRLWTETSEATLRDGVVPRIDAREYRRSSARKTRAALIPVTAVLHLRQRTDRAQAWDRFVTRYGRWHQLEDDVFDWREDLAHGRTTWLLWEAARHAGSPDGRSRPPMSGDAGAWMIREGPAWAFGMLDRLWVPAIRAARALEIPSLMTYLDARLEAHLARRRRHAAAHRGLSSLLDRVAGRIVEAPPENEAP